MPTHLALLRGVNVGGRNRVAMADLRAVAEALGHRDVATYIQSGNMVFSSDESDTVRLAVTLEEAVAGRLGVRAGVVVLTRSEVAQVMRDNPYPQESNRKAVHAVFHRTPISPERVAAVADAVQRARDKGSRDEARVIGCTLFLRTPDGLGRSELAARLTRPPSASSSEAAGTARNWATVEKLLALLEG